MLAKSAHHYYLSAQKYYYDQWKSRDLVRLREGHENFLQLLVEITRSFTEVIRVRILT